MHLIFCLSLFQFQICLFQFLLILMFCYQQISSYLKFQFILLTRKLIKRYFDYLILNSVCGILDIFFCGTHEACLNFVSAYRKGLVLLIFVRYVKRTFLWENCLLRLRYYRRDPNPKCGLQLKVSFGNL